MCVRNLGGTPAPYAFGAHPYLAISDPGRDGVSLALPASRAVELDPDLLVPSGTTRALAEPFRLDPEASYDNVFTDLSGADAVLTDRGGGRRIAIGYDGSITQLVIYAPREAPFVSWSPGPPDWTASRAWPTRLGATRRPSRCWPRAPKLESP